MAGDHKPDKAQSEPSRPPALIVEELERRFRYCDIKEAYEILNRHRKTLERWIHEGRLKATKLGLKYGIDPRELARLVRERELEGSAIGRRIPKTKSSQQKAKEIAAGKRQEQPAVAGQDQPKEYRKSLTSVAHLRLTFFDGKLDIYAKHRELVAEENARISQLTLTEREVLQELLTSEDTEAIANRRNVSIHTLRKQSQIIYETLNVHSRVELINTYGDVLNKYST